MKNKILMPFFMLGQFDEETTLDLVEMAVRGGADYLELGIPHTDPLADGKLLRETAHKAIAGGMTPRKAIDMVFKIRKKHQDIPIYILVYLNTLFGFGVEAFIEAVEDAGARGLVIPDLPLEAQMDLKREFDFGRLDLITFTSPTSSKRIEDIVQTASGFIYSVNYLGITGSRQNGHGVDERVIANYKAIKKHTNLLVLSGFGIDSIESAKLASEHADGVIIGSKICQMLEMTSASERGPKLCAFIQSVKAVL